MKAKRMLSLFAGIIVVAGTASYLHFCPAAGTTSRDFRPLTTTQASQGVRDFFRLAENDNSTVEQLNTAVVRLTGRSLDEVFAAFGRLNVKMTWFEVKGNKVTPTSKVFSRPFWYSDNLTPDTSCRMSDREDTFRGETPQSIEDDVTKGVYERYKLRIEGSLAKAPAWMKALVPALAECVAGRTFIYVPMRLRTWSDNITYCTIPMRRIQVSLLPDGCFAIETDAFLPFSVGGQADEKAYARRAEQITKDCHRWNLIWYPPQAKNLTFERISALKKGAKQ